eukprot:953729-Prymnesium_polylepis.1
MVPYEDVADRVELRAWAARRGLDAPIAERAAAFRQRLQESRDWQAQLLLKWQPRLAAARGKKAPGASGLRTEHLKPFYLADPI